MDLLVRSSASCTQVTVSCVSVDMSQCLFTLLPVDVIDGVTGNGTHEDECLAGDGGRVFERTNDRSSEHI